MAGFIVRLPLLLILIGIGGLAMLLPAGMALALDDHISARAFFYSALLVLLATIVVGFATQSWPPVTSSNRHLAGLVLSYLALPLVLALPLYEAVGNTSFFNAYFEMVSGLTTTGASLFAPERLSDAVHLWRALVGWLGGLLTWVTAAAVLGPLNLGGFEVSTEARDLKVSAGTAQIEAASPGHRLRRVALKMMPVYGGLTGVLWLVLVLGGSPSFAALCHAMSVMSTSGISPQGGLGGGGFLGELAILLFFLFALTRHSFSDGLTRRLPDVLAADRELRMAVYVAFTLTSLLFLRHWIGAFEVDQVADVGAAFAALWGALFTILSFITTTGFVSEFWGAARGWSGLGTPGLLLLALALMGGGVATTAGGIKLLRVYALYKHGTREMAKLIHPNSVAPGGRMGRRLRREGAYIAWVVFMPFVLSMATVMMLLAATGLAFEPAFVLSAAALSTTGPLAEYGGEVPIIYASLSLPAKAILTGAMILGRLETLAFIALMNPSFWRR